MCGGRQEAVRGSLFPLLWLALLLVAGCSPASRKTVPLEVPHGYVDRLWFHAEGARVGFGPFVGYYFKPDDPEDLRKLRFRCYNERRFYTLDLPENALLFEGTAVRTSLPPEGEIPGGEARVRPVFFPEAPESWKRSRPGPADEYRHFHSGYTEAGPARTGYWLRHVAVADFTYDMGGRVKSDSPLHHEVKPGVDTAFARVIEFDRGP